MSWSSRLSKPLYPFVVPLIAVLLLLCLALGAAAALGHPGHRHSDQDHEHRRDHHHHHDHADEHRHHGAHVHGAAELTLVLEGDTLWLELTLPGMDAVGFERAPANDEEREQLQQAVAVLEDLPRLIQISAGAQCELREVTVDDSQFAQTAAGHAELVARYRLVCVTPGALREISLPLLMTFSSLEQVRLQWIIDERQGAANVSATSPVRLN